MECGSYAFEPFLGFPIDPPVAEIASDWSKNYTQNVLPMQEQAWKSIIALDDLSVVKPSVLKRLLRIGVPPKWRPRVWLFASGAARRKRESGCGYYRFLLDQIERLPAKSSVVDVIDADIDRTYPEHPFFHSTNGKSALRRVLIAYSIHNASIGYCQSLNFIVGLFLLMMEEEDAFWMLVSLLEEHLAYDTHGLQLVGLQAEQGVFIRLLESRMTDVHRNFGKNDISVPMFTTRWFMMGFCNSLPVETVCRIWDSLFFEGSKIILRCALAIAKLTRDMLVKAESITDVLPQMKKFEMNLFDHERLMHEAFSVKHFPMKKIRAYRKAETKSVVAEMDERERKLKGEL